MYFSRIKLDENLSSTKKALASPQVMHAAVESLFLNDGTVKERNLWRVDRCNGKLFLLIVSPKNPDFSRLEGQFCSMASIGEVKDYSNLLKSLTNKKCWHFRLRANVTHSVPMKEEDKRGKIYAHTSITSQKEWLKRKANENGFSVKENEFEVIETNQIKFRRGSKDLVTLGIVVFEGDLSITDSEKFVLALVKGVGRAKAYGCGMLTIAPK